MMRCDRSQNLFARAWDDELTVAERESLEAHWSACTACRRAYDEYARTLELVQALPRPVVGADFAARVLSEARRREAETKVASGWGRSGWAFGLAPRPAFALAAAFAVVLGVGAIMLYAPQPGITPAKQVVQPVPEVASVVPDTKPEAAPSRVDVAPAPTATLATLAPTVSARTERRAAPATIVADAAVVPDSLFDHTNDVELVLDPVQLRRERGRGYTPVPTTVRGEAASITF